MIGVLFSIIAGALMSFQGVFNTKLSEKVGSWETNFIVQLTGAILTFIIMMIFGKGELKEVKNANKIYLLGGVLGVAIIFTVMEGMKNLGPTYAVAAILVAQLVTAALIEAFGLFHASKVKFSLNEMIGVAIMIIGIIVFKWKSY